MRIMLGNLTIEQMQTRSGATFPKELIDYMSDKHQDLATDIKHGKWHCFDIPFTLVCGDIQTATEIHNHLKPLSKSFKQVMQIALSK
jgi:hypothetical protein